MSFPTATILPIYKWPQKHGFPQFRNTSLLLLISSFGKQPIFPPPHLPPTDSDFSREEVNFGNMFNFNSENKWSLEVALNFIPKEVLSKANRSISYILFGNEFVVYPLDGDQLENLLCRNYLWTKTF